MRPGKYIRNSIETLYFVLFLCDKLGQIFLHVYNGTVIQFFVTSQTFSMAQIFMYSYWSLHVVTFTYLYVFIYVMVEICVVLVAVKCFIFLCQASVLLWQHVFFHGCLIEICSSGVLYITYPCFMYGNPCLIWTGCERKSISSCVSFEKCTLIIKMIWKATFVC